MKTLSNRTGGRLANQLYFVLQAYCFSKRNCEQFKYVPIQTFARKTDISIFQEQLNIQKYLCTDTNNIDIMQPLNEYYQIIGKDFDLSELNGFIIETISKSKYLQQLKQNIISNNAAIHIRNGDYLQIPLYYKTFDRIEYLKKALNLIPNEIKSIDVFSDDNELNKKTYGDIFKTRFNNVNYINGNDECTDLLMLSLHRIKILWNSTFSLWSAYIGNMQFQDQVVICPKNFDLKTTMENRILKGWKVI